MAAYLPIIQKIQTNILNPIITLLFVVALAVFLYGVFEFIKDSGSEQGRTKGKMHMIAGIFGLFIMVSVFGIISLLCRTLGVC